MKEIGPTTGIDCKNTMTEINHANRIDHQDTTKMTIKERIIALFRTMEIGENIKIIIKTNIEMKSSTTEIDLMTEMIHIVEIGLMVEIDCKTTTEMSIRGKIINIREGLELIMKMHIKTGTVGININTNAGMAAMTEVKVGLEKKSLT